ncbi:conserved hypothetical protein [Thiomonas arsenitoxydans]|uniref:Winged helix-turn-helix domain-containing protein n=1 Tax=Thiomonas arsenitoxydans (strain DSM 22701 / CIP 110005 / 3As) TaxID=426114 RepID=D6CLC1_THIA3|nr:helix-turn-helix domain-containing protein [Thiomonas arsenitoxydans]CQR45527.1 conserved hypothetical protein [Thiomonas sp. CB3]CAZ89349.1 hypothetical protein THI_2736 [Thiomonas arsenitoxydans]CQR33891.1 conserved hypothetical protein [Thiomonas arsenitoxydans]CQR37768.1 conserved hypothetical protein [Thiomonas arsenitoxydans]CQR37908.1 conserved hypothetical protein [Thiomonas arsenitoxydans]
MSAPNRSAAALSEACGAGNGADENEQLFHGNGAAQQRARLLRHLQEHGQIDTLTARRELDILMPAARVFELRALGEPITLVWVTRTTDCGKPHRVGLYIWGGSGEDALQ